MGINHGSCHEISLQTHRFLEWGDVWLMGLYIKTWDHMGTITFTYKYYMVTLLYMIMYGYILTLLGDMGL